jgi:surfactin synthase thioesterase subunit
MRLFCFSYAGAGAAAYRLWPAALPAEIELVAIQLPGRESRLREQAYSNIGEIIAALEPALAPHVDLPFALFGHSLGAVVAVELARALERGGMSRPAHLFVSARRPPRIPDALPPMHALPDAQFIDEVQRRYGGIPAEILAQPDVMELLLPGLRADITALETHAFVDGPALASPITAFGGMQDARTPRAHLDAWRRETAAEFQVREFPGDHFYFVPQREAVAAEIVAAVAPVIRPGGHVRRQVLS